MSKLKLTINGQALIVNKGDTLVDAALRGRIVIPHDCCSGQCDTCRVDVLKGAVETLGTQRGTTVQACMARIKQDASIYFDEVPQVVQLKCEVSSIRPISSEIYEVILHLPDDFTYLPGQYVSLAFHGFPAREYSPTVFEDGTQDPRVLVFHIKKYEGGLISSQIGKKIKLGTKVMLKGPFGHAFYREGQSRLILVGTGTGFAPLWSLAREAIMNNPKREIYLIMGAQNGANLYMSPALSLLRREGVKNIVLCASKQGFVGGIKRGRPTDFLPLLTAQDTVYAAGVPAMVESVTQLALKAQATIYADPFTMSSTRLSLFNRLQQAMTSPLLTKSLALFAPRSKEGIKFQPQSVSSSIMARKETQLPAPTTKGRKEEKRKVVNR